MDDDDDDDNHHDDDYDNPQNHYPANTVTTHQPPLPITPQQPLQPPKPLFSPSSRPPSKKHPTPSATPPPPQPPIAPQQPLQPPQPIFLPTSPPTKSRPPPPYDNRYDDDNDDDNDRRRQLCAVISILLLLLGLTALILWLLYRPSKPHFIAISAAVYSLNATLPPPFVSASVQITVVTRNPSKRTALYYDRLVASVHYQNHPITPPVSLPPLKHLKRSAVMMSPAIGGAPVVAPPEVVEGLVADEAYGVVGLSWVLVGRVKYRAGWFRSGHSRVYVRCDIMVGFKSGGGNPSGQVPLLGNPPCFVDI
ncbi:NDR1/HIN1-like protein 1 [Beta vulgaris subsp. vulgaris]|uniref:NDR1/HIN1-like protein 1 n=1 Tax=Beta vulgaris subsp. vulgaris TaxID=3555 RepID=UPI00203729A3|nr:NDR1/HIN1-like protein 1 [Beta vulgaris subsp. vulgaris]